MPGPVIDVRESRGIICFEMAMEAASWLMNQLLCLIW
jgi:hypothetical protein